MNLDDAVDDYNSKFNESLGVYSFFGNESDFIRLVGSSLLSGDRIPRRELNRFFKRPKKGIVF